MTREASQRSTSRGGAVRALIHVVYGLESARPFVRFEDVCGSARGRRGLPRTAEGVRGLLEEAVREGMLFTERRLAFEREELAFRETRVYRVNLRHPLVAGVVGAD